MAHHVRSFLLALTALLTIMLQPMQAPAQTPRPAFVLVPGPAAVDEPMRQALQAAFERAGSAIPLQNYYAVTNLQRRDRWAFVSVSGLSQVHAGQRWTLQDDAAWIGLVLLAQSADGTWSGDVEGTAGFSAALALIPAQLVGDAAKASLDPARRRLAPAEAYRFPWQTGTSMQYGILGVHDGGFASLGQYKAVDLLSDGDTAAGHAPNSLLAAASGAIDYVCNDGTSVAIRIGSLLYLHLLANANLAVPHTFAQGDVLGQLKTGTFTGAYCGYASQGANWFHVHWAFPDIGTFQAGGWTLTWTPSGGGGTWQRGSETRVPLDWLLSENAAPTLLPLPDLRPYTPASQSAPVVPAPLLGTHVTGTLVAGQTAYFTWYFINDGYASTSSSFAAELWIDGGRAARVTTSNLEPGLIGSVLDWATVVVTPGWHTVRLVIDPDNAIAELDETNNAWQGQFYWQPVVLQNVPAGWHSVFLPRLTQ